jgi:hypothetical protein
MRQEVVIVDPDPKNRDGGPDERRFKRYRPDFRGDVGGGPGSSGPPKEFYTRPVGDDLNKATHNKAGTADEYQTTSGE